MYIPVTLEAASRRKCLAATFPIADVCTLITRSTVGVSQMSLKVVFPGKGLVAA